MKIPKEIHEAALDYAEVLGQNHNNALDGMCDLGIGLIPEDEMCWEWTSDWLGQFYMALNLKNITGYDLPLIVALYNVAETVVIAVGRHPLPKENYVATQWKGYAFDFGEMGAYFFDQRVLGETRH